MGWVSAWQQQPRVQRWLQRRLPAVREVVLNQRRIFIFLSREGGLFVGLLLITFIAGINYGNNLILLVCFFLSSVLVVSMHQTYLQLSGLRLAVLDAELDAVAGQTVMVRLQLSGLRAHHQIELEYETQRLHLDQVSAALEVAWPVTPTIGRGWWALPRLTVSSKFPLGILRSWSYVTFAGGVWVSPQPHPVSLSGLRSAQLGEVDVGGAQGVVGQEEFDQLRSHVAGEALARVSWAHVARGQGMWSKQFIDPQVREDWVDYQQMPGSSHEVKLAQMAFCVEQLHQAGQTYGLRLPQHRLDLHAGPRQRQQALRLLAQVP